MKDLLQKICKEMNYTGEIVARPERASDVLCHNASNAKICEMIDYALTPFNQGLSQTLSWYGQTIGVAK